MTTIPAREVKTRHVHKTTMEHNQSIAKLEPRQPAALLEKIVLLLEKGSSKDL